MLFRVSRRVSLESPTQGKNMYPLIQFTLISKLRPLDSISLGLKREDTKR